MGPRLQSDYPVSTCSLAFGALPALAPGTRHTKEGRDFPLSRETGRRSGGQDPRGWQERGLCPLGPRKPSSRDDCMSEPGAKGAGVRRFGTQGQDEYEKIEKAYVFRICPGKLDTQLLLAGNLIVSFLCWKVVAWSLAKDLLFSLAKCTPASSTYTSDVAHYPRTCESLSTTPLRPEFRSGEIRRSSFFCSSLLRLPVSYARFSLIPGWRAPSERPLSVPELEESLDTHNYLMRQGGLRQLNVG